MELKFRNNRHSLKDVDLSKRTVEGYLSAFGNMDSDGDVIVNGAFKKTLSENKERIAHLLQHDTWSPIGKFLELEEDANGLRFVSQMSQSTKGQDTLIQYQEGILKEHSIGFNVVKGETRNDYYEIQEVKLWEGSTVTFGANPNTPVTGIKAENAHDEVLERIKSIESFLRKGKVSDDAFRMLEFEMQILKQNIETLKKEPQTHSEIVEPSFDFEKFNSFLKN